MKTVFALAALAAVASALPQKRASSCPADLNGDFTAPYLIVPVNASNPNAAYGTQYDGYIVGSSMDSLFEFSVPSSYAGMTCSLIFLMPNSANIQTFSGDGLLNFDLMTNDVTQSTTWNNKGPVKVNHGNITVKEGNNYVVNSFACTAGYDLPYQMSSADGTTDLVFFEDKAAPPVGLYIRAC